jgi:branched-chain amino acid aminotransferase
MTKVYISGKFYEKQDAKVSVFDHGLLYGDGVFEGIRIYNGKIFKLKEHVDRLYDSAKGILLDIPISREAFAEAIQRTVQTNDRREGYIRALVTRGSGSLGLDPRKTTDPQIIVIVEEISLYPAELYEQGMEVMSVGTIRNHPSALNPRIKSLNYLNNIMAKWEAIKAGCLEAVMLNHKGEVAEGSGDNIFVVKNGGLKTPSLDSGILEGVTRNLVIQLARDQGFAVAETALTRHDLYTADEVFLTGTACEIMPVVKVDARMIGTGKPGPTVKRLRESFTKLTHT